MSLGREYSNELEGNDRFFFVCITREKERTNPLIMPLTVVHTVMLRLDPQNFHSTRSVVPFVNLLPENLAFVCVTLIVNEELNILLLCLVIFRFILKAVPKREI